MFKVFLIGIGVIICVGATYYLVFIKEKEKD